MDTRDFLKDLPARAAGRKKEHQGAVKRLRKIRSGEIEALMEELHRRAFDEIDCLDCGNCCRSLGPRITERDLTRLAKIQGFSAAAFCETFLRRDEDNDWVFKSMPCPFLGEDNYCFVYENRPRACADYPHTEGRQVRSRLGELVKNAPVCPAVFLVLEGIAEETGGRG
jgi:hypothetical protein